MEPVSVDIEPENFPATAAAAVEVEEERSAGSEMSSDELVLAAGGETTEKEVTVEVHTEQLMPTVTIVSPRLTDPVVDKLTDIQRILDHNSSSPQTFVNSLPDPVRRRVKALKKLQLDYFNLEAKFYQELHSLECRYEHLYTPILRRRCDIVGAAVEPTEEECSWMSDEEEEGGKGKSKGHQQRRDPTTQDGTNDGLLVDEVKDKLIISKNFSDDSPSGKLMDGGVTEGNLKGIPGFWLRIFQNVDILAEQIQKPDEPILKSLLDIRVIVEENTTPPKFRLEFMFAPNEYFTNPMLTKDYEMTFEPDKSLPLLYDGPDIVKCFGCTIDWKTGKNVTEKQVHKVQRHKTKGTKKTVVKIVKAESFFNFFSPPEVLEGQEPSEEVEDLLSADFEVGHFLRNQVIPRAVLYYTGDALLDSDDDYDSDDADDDDEVSSEGGHESGDGRQATEDEDED